MLCLSTLLFVPGAASSDAGAQVYRWIDEDGNTHYTVLQGELGKRREPPKPAPLPQATDVAEPLPSPRPPPLPQATDIAEPLPPPRPPPLPQKTDVAEPLPPPRPPPQVKLGPPALQQPAVPKRTPFPTPPSVTTLEENADEISELEKLITRDKEVIKDLISQERVSGEDLLANPQLREIAQRLPRLQSELRALRGETWP